MRLSGWHNMICAICFMSPADRDERKTQQKKNKIRTRNKPIGGDACCSQIHWYWTPFFGGCVCIYITEVCRLRLPHEMGEKKINKKKDFSLVSLSSLDDRWEELQTERVWLLLLLLPLFPPSFFSFYFSLERLYFITTQTSRVECVGMGQTFSSAVLSYSTLLRLVLSVGGRHCLSRNCKYICEFRAVAVDVVDDRRLEFLQTTRTGRGHNASLWAY